MSKSSKILIITFISLLVIPLSAQAFWPWNKNNNEFIQEKVELSLAEHALVTAKYKLWEESFENKNIEAVILNKDNFWFSLPEISHLFNTANERSEKPLLSDLKLEREGDNLKIEATFKKIIKGRLSFIAGLSNNNEKINLEITKLKIFNIPLPASLFSKPANKSLDDYFNFMYQDERYQGFNIKLNDVLKLELFFN